MKFLDHPSGYGWISIALHWLSALLVFTLIPLGLWMVELDYYDSWYKKGPDLHRSLGVLLALLLMLRLGWRIGSGKPAYPEDMPRWQVQLAVGVHHLMYLLLFALVITGYLISTADGRAVAVFDWFEIPATLQNIEGQEDIAGDIHFILAMTLLGFVALHLLGAIKHALTGHKQLLLRMLTPGRTLNE